MTRPLKIITLLILIPYLPVFSQLSDQDRDLLGIIRERGQAEVMMPFPGRRALEELSLNTSVGRVDGDQVLVILSPLTAGWFINKKYRYEVIPREDHKGIVTAQSKAEAMEWNTYPTWQQYDSIVHYYADNYPHLCRLETIGTSTRGRSVYALEIHDNQGGGWEDKPGVFYTSTIHGDEPGGFVLMLRLADHLLRNYDTDERIRNLVDNLRIWINPLANPDGTYNSGDTIRSPVRFNANGYDLNRNFPDPDVVNPPGQKETIDMIRFLSENRFVLSANFHSGAEVVNYPWDRWQRLHADNAWFHAVSRAYADTVHKYSEPGYMTSFDNGITNGYQWYRINGGRQDYVTWELQGREVTIEIDKEFITPAGRLEDLWEFNRESLLGFIENAIYGIHGRVTDFMSGMPVPASVMISSHDKDNSHVYSDTLTGRFVRFLGPGTWDLTVSADGYRDTVVTLFIADIRQKSDLMIQMKRILNPVDTTAPPRPLLYPNPAAFYIRAVMPVDLRGELNIRIYDPAGRKIRDYDSEAYEGSPVIIDVRTMSSGVYTAVFRNLTTGAFSTGRFIVARQYR